MVQEESRAPPKEFTHGRERDAALRRDSGAILLDPPVSDGRGEYYYCKGNDPLRLPSAIKTVSVKQLLSLDSRRSNRSEGHCRGIIRRDQIPTSRGVSEEGCSPLR